MTLGRGGVADIAGVVQSVLRREATNGNCFTAEGAEDCR